MTKTAGEDKKKSNGNTGDIRKLILLFLQFCMSIGLAYFFYANIKDTYTDTFISKYYFLGFYLIIFVPAIHIFGAFRIGDFKFFKTLKNIIFSLAYTNIFVGIITKAILEKNIPLKRAFIISLLQILIAFTIAFLLHRLYISLYNKEFSSKFMEKENSFIITVRKFRKSILFIAKAILMGVLVLAFDVVWVVSFPSSTFFKRGNFLMVVLYAGLLYIFTRVYNAMKFGIFRLTEIAYSFFLSIIFTNTAVYFQLSLMSRQMLPIMPIIQLSFIQLFLAIAISYIINKMYFRLYPPREILIVRPNSSDAGLLIKKMTSRKERYTVKAVLSEDTPIDRIFETINEYEATVVGDIDLILRYKISNYCSKTRKRLYIVPNSGDIMLKNANDAQIFDTPLYYFKNSGLSTEMAFFKRIMDIFISLVGLVLTSPIMLITAIAIKIEDRGPVFFSQERLTIGGKIFKVHKFRSMVLDAEKDGVMLAEKDDPRVTKVGKIIRKVRIDELPQLYNVLIGEMSIVGPRPERPEIAKEYEKNLPDFALRLGVKAGLSGYAQIYGKYNTSPKDKLMLDLIYIENYSLLMDIKLVLMTIKIIFMPESTEGFDEGAGRIETQKE